MTHPVPDTSLHPSGRAVLSRRGVAAALLAALLPLRARAQGETRTLAVYGDSQAQGLAATLVRAARGQFRVLNRTKPATGVAQPATYDWVQALRDSLAADRPTVAVMMLGANDRVPARLPGNVNYPFRGEAWLSYYRERIAQMIRACAEAGVPLVWCGNPLSRDAGYARDMRYLNDLVREAMPDDRTATYLDVWTVGADAAGGFQSHGPGLDGRVQRLRTDDGIHFTAAGYELVARRVMEAVAAILPETAASATVAPGVFSGLAGPSLVGPSLVGLAMLALASCGPAPPPVAEAPLAPLHDALAELERGTRTAPVVILQVGDSHTANDAFGTRMREGLQGRFGAAGRGPLPPGIPFRTYDPTLVRVTADPAWRPIGSLPEDSQGPFGLAGVRQRAEGPGATMTLETLVEGGLARAEVEILRRPGGGTLEVFVDGRPAGRITGEAARPEAAFVKLPTGAATRQVALRTLGDGPVELLGWSASREGPGVLYANLGTIGATVETARRWDPAVVRTELGHLRPTLLVVAFGTNEGFKEEFDPNYGRRYAEAVRSWQAAAPGAAVLVIGPPDGDWRAGRAGPGAAEECTDGAPGRAAWRKPPHLAAVRAAQREAARANGWAYWDWSAAMGGNCAMHLWSGMEPPLGQPDHVHLRAAGYRRTADALLREILEGYERRRGRVPGRAPGA